MHLGGASFTQHVGDLGSGGAADDRVVYQDNTLAGNRCLEDIELDVYRSLPLLLGRQDEGSADVTVFDKADAVRDAGLLRIAERRIQTGIRGTDDDVCLDRVLDCQEGAGALS